MEMDDDSDLSSLSDSEAGDSPTEQPFAESDSESDAEQQAIATTSFLPAEDDNTDMSCSDADIDSDPEGDDVQTQTGSVKSRSGKIWHDVAPTCRRRGPQDIVRGRSGLTAAGKSVESVADSFRIFITAELVQLTAQHTNEEGERLYAEYNKKHPTNQKKYHPFDEDELYACIGLLILAGVLKGKHEICGATFVAVLHSLQQCQEIASSSSFVCVDSTTRLLGIKENSLTTWLMYEKCLIFSIQHLQSLTYPVNFQRSMNSW